MKRIGVQRAIPKGVSQAVVNELAQLHQRLSRRGEAWDVGRLSPPDQLGQVRQQLSVDTHCGGHSCLSLIGNTGSHISRRASFSVKPMSRIRTLRTRPGGISAWSWNDKW